jgi:hypothetical protein
MNIDDLYTMLYWILGIIAIIFLVDWIWYKPFNERKKTDKIITELCSNNTLFQKSLPKYTLDKGILTHMNKHTFIEGLLLLNTLRNIGCKLPILVFYNKDDLLTNQISVIESIPNTKTRLIDVKNEEIKAHSLINSPFKEVLIIEPDILFIKPPDFLFEDPVYKSTGAVFWKDYPKKTVWDKKTQDWVKKIIPYRNKNNPILNKELGSFQSNSILLINKLNHKKTMEKLWLLTNNWKHIHKFLDSKEFYWLSAEISNEPYFVISHNPGIIGQLQNRNPDQVNCICGKLLYMDNNGDPLFCSGSVFDVNDKNTVMEFTHYSKSNKQEDWYNDNILTTSNEMCIYNTNILDLPEGVKNLFNNYLFILQKIRKQISNT